MSKLPTGLAGAHNALANHSDSHRLVERLTTLIWLRLLTDPTCPLIGGHDPRLILTLPLHWDEFPGFTPEMLDVLCGRLNEVMGEPLLSADWHELPPESVAAAIRELARWQMPAGDPLGVAYTEIRSASAIAGLGAFYTPYHVSLMMAMMTETAPGESVCDPCCGSGGMLLAAIEACRTAHGPDAHLELYGVDIDAGAVRLCKLNLALAGYGPAGRAYAKDSLDSAPPALRAAREQWEETQLPLFQ